MKGHLLHRLSRLEMNCSYDYCYPATSLSILPPNLKTLVVVLPYNEKKTSLEAMGRLSRRLPALCLLDLYYQCLTRNIRMFDIEPEAFHCPTIISVKSYTIHMAPPRRRTEQEIFSALRCAAEYLWFFNLAPGLLTIEYLTEELQPLI